ncbi:MAG: hypothetical protein AAF223_11565 [Bacteroidota bacterium]
MNQTADLLDIVQRMEQLVGQGDWAAAANCFTSQVLYKVADREPVYGVEGIEHYMVWQNKNAACSLRECFPKITSGVALVSARYVGRILLGVVARGC